jgi:transposase
LLLTAFSCPNLLAAVKDNPAAMAELTALLKMLSELSDKVARLEARIDQLTTNSHTSSKPPSSDRHNPNKPPPRSLRRSSGRARGGQPGHAGHSLERTTEPDEVLETPLAANCPECGEPLESAKVETVEVQPRQVIEVEPPKRRVVEHRGRTVRCPRCGALIAPNFPGGVNAPVQYGNSVQTMVVYLSVWQLLPSHRLSEMMDQLFGCPLSPGSVVTMLRRAAENSAAVVAAIKERILKEPWACFDETGLSLGGLIYWLHTASTPDYTLLHTHPKRGVEGIVAGGVLPGFKGRAIHDFLAAYMSLGLGRHGLCNGHHVRDLNFIEEVLKQSWGATMIEFLVETKNKVEPLHKKGRQLSSRQLDKLQDRYFQILEEGYEQNPEPPPKIKGQRGRPARGKALNLLDRFREHSEAIMAFLLHPGVPFDNNHAERDLRMMKIRQKISGCFRALDAPELFARLRSVVATAAKHSVSALRAIEVLFEPNPTLEAIIQISVAGT